MAVTRYVVWLDGLIWKGGNRWPPDVIHLPLTREPTPSVLADRRAGVRHLPITGRDAQLLAAHFREQGFTW